MADQRTMAELLRVPTEGYAEAIVVPPILAEHFELKHSLINMITLDQFFRLEKDNPHDHIRAARRWLEKEPLVPFSLEKILFLNSSMNSFLPQERQISEMKFLTFNNVDQDSLNSAAGGNLLERHTQDVLTIIENKSKVRNSRNKSIVSQVISSDANSSSSSEIAKLTHALNHQTSVATTAMTAILKQFQATPPSVFVKAVEEICVTCGVAHPYYQCLTADGNTFSEFRDNIQGYISAAAVNYNQVVPLSELEKIKKMNEINIKAMQTQINNVKNELTNEMKTSIQASMSNQTNVLKNMMASFCQMNTASTSGSGSLPSNTIANPKGELKAMTTRNGLVLDVPSIPMPPTFINPKEDKRAEETLTDQDLAEYIKKMLKALISNKEKLLELSNTPLNENCSAVILTKLPEKLGDLGKFLILCGFSELKCKALADLANRAICTPVRIARDVFVQVGKFTFSADFVIVDYESDPRVPFILGRPFLRTTCALIDVHREEMILRDGDERLTLNMRHDTSSYSNQPQKESINMINIYNDSYEDYLEYLFATNHLSGNLTFSSHTDLTSPKVINHLSGNPTSSSPDHLLEEFTDKLTLITFLPGNDDLPFEIESDLREIEYLLNQDPTKEMDSILEDSVDEGNLVDPNNDLFNTIPEMFTDEHTLKYSSSPLYDDVDDDLVEFEFDNDDVYNDPFDSKEDKIKEIFSEVDALPSTDNEDKVFNPGILIPENLFEVTVQETPSKNVKKISISNASLILKDFNPPLYELPFHKEVPGFETLLSFSFENEEKVSKPGILTSKGVHTSLLLKLSHRGPKTFKVVKIFESPMEIFPCSYREDIRTLDVPCLHFYPS
uniref:Reverse transcriptase domain-containing protein n=1 Tax=Tanacetum cinerariifolium TaxID=118510 RepID=A0A6L2L2U4_TANCI|nr:hypothetical protein [Tanacetum cinerariifolium]